MSQINLQPNQKCQIVDDGVKVEEMNKGKLTPALSFVKRGSNSASYSKRGLGSPASAMLQALRAGGVNELLEIHVPADTSVEYFLNWQDQSVERKIIFHLDGCGASAKLIGLFLGKADQEFHLNSTMVHHAPNTTGNTLVKGALKDSSRAILKGLIKIDRGAQGSDDLLTERVLLLSPKARAEADPQLEIEANEVRATHAATISRLNKEHLYYLQTRGIPLPEAQQFVVDGFLQEIVDLMP